MNKSKAGDTVIYFDNAATTFPKPNSVVQAVNRGMVYYGGNPGRSGHEMSIRASEKVFGVRQQIADFFDADVENVIFTCNCSHALNLAIKGVMLGGGHVVSTNLEHNSVLRPLVSLAEKQHVTYSIVDVLKKSNEQIVNDISGAIRPDTRLVVCTHGSNVTGDIMPILEISKLCKRLGIVFAVDAAQSAGVLPIKVREMGIDLLCTAGHKGLYGPTGTGILVLRESMALGTLIEGGTGSNSFEPRQPDFYPDRLEAGTLNTVGICGLGAGVEYISRVGIDNIYRHEMNLVQKAFNRMKDFDHVILYDDEFESGAKLPVLLFNVREKTSMEMVDILSKSGFALRGGVHCSPLVHKGLHTDEEGAVRLSVSMFNTEQEIERFISQIKRIPRN